MSDDDALKTKEDWLRQELRASRTLLTSILQWGVAVLSVVELKLYDIRREVTKHQRLVQRQRSDDHFIHRWLEDDH